MVALINFGRGNFFMINGLFETHIHVRDIERSAKFYEQVLGLELGHVEEKRRARFYWIGGRGNAMLGVWEVPEEKWVREHFAFKSTVENIKKSAAWLTERGLEYRNFDDTGHYPLKVWAWGPAISIFFKDPDGHSLEFAALLPDDPKPELGVVPWAEWEELHGRKLDVDL
jgi:catechol 2,3-dioxygenase-like lactoylglutathione lyase family enzyme